jgi:hypothetical protein
MAVGDLVPLNFRSASSAVRRHALTRRLSQRLVSLGADATSRAGVRRSESIDDERQAIVSLAPTLFSYARVIFHFFRGRSTARSRSWSHWRSARASKCASAICAWPSVPRSWRDAIRVCEQRSIIIEREPHHVLFLGLRVRLWRVFGEAVGRDKAAALRLEPATPVRRRHDADDRWPARARWRRHAPAHHGQFAAELRTAGAGWSGNTPGTGGRLPTFWFSARNSAAMAAWLVAMP